MADKASLADTLDRLSFAGPERRAEEEGKALLTALVDLADAQLKVKKGEEQPEAHNASLAALVDIIDALAASKKKTIDFESSRLTELLQDCLGGNSKSMMMLCVDPHPESATISTQCLQFAEKAKGVKLGAASKNKESMHTAMTKVNTTMSALTAMSKGGGSTSRGP